MGRKIAIIRQCAHVLELSLSHYALVSVVSALAAWHLARQASPPVWQFIHALEQFSLLFKLPLRLPYEDPQVCHRPLHLDNQRLWS